MMKKLSPTQQKQTLTRKAEDITQKKHKNKSLFWLLCTMSQLETAHSPVSGLTV